MYKIKTTSYNIDAKIAPDVEILEEGYATKEGAEWVAIGLAKALCDELNKIDNKNGNYFEIGSYKEVYFPGGIICPFYPVSILWYDHAPDDRMCDCDVRIVVGYEIFEEN